MNYSRLSETLLNSLADLPPELRERILTDTIRAVMAHDEKAIRDSRICALLKQGLTTREISKRLRVSLRDIHKVKCG
jgi:DNA-binding NarL/FixJ family response regulator